MPILEPPLKVPLKPRLEVPLNLQCLVVFWLFYQVETWGAPDFGGDSRAVKEQLQHVMLGFLLPTEWLGVG